MKLIIVLVFTLFCIALSHGAHDHSHDDHEHNHDDHHHHEGHHHHEHDHDHEHHHHEDVTDEEASSPFTPDEIN